MPVNLIPMTRKLLPILAILSLASMVSACQPPAAATAPAPTPAIAISAGIDPQSAHETALKTAAGWDQGAHLIVYSASYRLKTDKSLALDYYVFDFASADAKSFISVTVDSLGKVKQEPGPGYPVIPYPFGQETISEQQALSTGWTAVGKALDATCGLSGIAIQGHPAETLSTPPYWLLSFWRDPTQGAVAFLAVDSETGVFLNDTPAINQKACPGLDASP